jgi:hypothetical protein
MTGNYGPGSEEVVASAEGTQEAMPTPERGESGRPGGGRGNNTTTDLEQAVRFASRARDNRLKDVPDHASNEPLVDTSRIPSAADRGTRSISGTQAAANEYAALDSGQLGPVR